MVAGKINGILAKNVILHWGRKRPGRETYIENEFRGRPSTIMPTTDMDVLTEMVDAFGGVEVYVPQNMRYYKRKRRALWRASHMAVAHRRWAATANFLLRYRQGPPRLTLTVS